jgi:hypothetical protein
MTASAFTSSLTLDGEVNPSATRTAVVVTGAIICGPDGATTDDADISVTSGTVQGMSS